MSLVRITKHSCTQSGVFSSGQTIKFKLPDNILYDLSESKLQYKLKVANPHIGQLYSPLFVFGDGSGLALIPDILFSNAHMRNSAEGIISQSPFHGIRATNEYIYQTDWIEQNCYSTWSYGEYVLPNDSITSTIIPAVTLDLAKETLISHPLSRFFERVTSYYETKISTEMSFELDSNELATKFCSVSSIAANIVGLQAECDDTLIKNTETFLQFHEISFTHSNPHAVNDFPVNSIVLLTCDVDKNGLVVPHDRTFIVAAVDNNGLEFLNAAGQGDNLIPITNPATADYTVNNVFIRRIDYTGIKLVQSFNTGADGKISVVGGERRLYLVNDYASADEIKIIPGEPLVLSYSDDDSGALGDPTSIVVKSVNFVPGANLSYITIENDPHIAINEIGQPVNAQHTIFAGILFSNATSTYTPTQGTTFEIIEPELILKSVEYVDPYVELPTFYFMIYCTPFNFTLGNRLTKQISLHENCKLVVFFTPMNNKVVSVTDNALHYRLKLDYFDTTTTDINLPSFQGNCPIYHYLLDDNYGSLRKLNNVKVDPGLDSPMLMISQLIPDNTDKIHIDLYSDDVNMSSKTVFVYQYVLVPL